MAGCPECHRHIPTLEDEPIPDYCPHCGWENDYDDDEDTEVRRYESLADKEFGEF